MSWRLWAGLDIKGHSGHRAGASGVLIVAVMPLPQMRGVARVHDQTTRQAGVNDRKLHDSKLDTLKMRRWTTHAHFMSQHKKKLWCAAKEALHEAALR